MSVVEKMRNSDLLQVNLYTDITAGLHKKLV